MTPWQRPAHDDPARAPEPPGHVGLDCATCAWWTRETTHATWGVCRFHDLALTHQASGCDWHEAREAVTR